MPKGGARRNSGPKKGSTWKQRGTVAKERGRARALRQLDITAERAMLEAGRIAFALRSSMWKDGCLLPFEDWPPDAIALLEGFEVVIKNAAAGDGHTDTVHKVHLAKKWPALEAIMKHFNLISDRTDVTLHASDDLLAKLDRIKALNRAKSEPER